LESGIIDSFIYNHCLLFSPLDLEAFNSMDRTLHTIRPLRNIHSLPTLAAAVILMVPDLRLIHLHDPLLGAQELGPLSLLLALPQTEALLVPVDRVAVLEVVPS